MTGHWILIGGDFPKYKELTAVYTNEALRRAKGNKSEAARIGGKRGQARMPCFMVPRPHPKGMKTNATGLRSIEGPRAAWAKLNSLKFANFEDFDSLKFANFEEL